MITSHFLLIFAKQMPIPDAHYVFIIKQHFEKFVDPPGYPASMNPHDRCYLLISHPTLKIHQHKFLILGTEYICPASQYVNPIREKKLTNVRASGSDDNILLKPPRKMSLEAASEYIEDDEYVEVTPKVIRLRKIHLTENARKRNRR